MGMSFDEEKRAQSWADLQELHTVSSLNDEEARAIKTTCKAAMERGEDVDVAGVVAAFQYRRDERRRDEEQRRRAMEERNQEIEWKRRWGQSDYQPPNSGSRGRVPYLDVNPQNHADVAWEEHVRRTSGGDHHGEWYSG
jgi:hypothetical protein